MHQNAIERNDKTEISYTVGIRLPDTSGIQMVSVSDSQMV